MKNRLLLLDSKWIEDRQPCKESVEWLNKRRSKRIDLVMMALIKEEKYAWAEWLLSRELGQKDRILWVSSIAREVLPLYENTYPGDLRPRKAIEAAEDYANEPSEENLRKVKGAEKEAAWAEARAAWAAEAEARAARAAAEAEARAAWAEARAARAAEAAARVVVAAAEGAAAWAAAEVAAALRYSGIPEEQVKAARKKWIEQGFEMLMAGYDKELKS